MATLAKIVQETVFECVTKDINLDFPDFLKNLRAKMGFSGKALSKHIEISSCDYNDFENKTYYKNPTDKQLSKIAEFYEVNVELLKKKRDEFARKK
jgi:transcriptional regulator with XRE-family HTH domain